VGALKGFGCEVEEIDYTQSRTIEEKPEHGGYAVGSRPGIGGRKKDG